MTNEEQPNPKRHPSVDEARESLLVTLGQISDELNAIHEQLVELRKDVKTRGGKKYNALIRSFATLTKRYNDIFYLQATLEKLGVFKSSGGADRDFISRVKQVLEREEQERFEKKMLMAIKGAAIIKRTQIVSKTYNSDFSE